MDIQGYGTKLSNALYMLQQREILCDVNLHTKSSCVKAHQIVLIASGSSYLINQIFKTKHSALGNNVCNIDFKDYDHNDVLAVIKLLYTGTINPAYAGSQMFCKLLNALQIDSLTFRNDTQTDLNNLEHLINMGNSSVVQGSFDQENLLNFPVPVHENLKSSSFEEEKTNVFSDFGGDKNVFKDNNDFSSEPAEGVPVSTNTFVSIVHEKQQVLDGRIESENIGNMSKTKHDVENLSFSDDEEFCEELDLQGTCIQEKFSSDVDMEMTNVSSDNGKKMKVKSAKVHSDVNHSVKNKSKTRQKCKKENKVSKCNKGIKFIKYKSESSGKIYTCASDSLKMRLETICFVCDQNLVECSCEVFKKSLLEKKICSLCRIKFPDVKNYLIHKKEKHSLTCKMCDYEISKGSNLVEHLLLKHGLPAKQLQSISSMNSESVDQQPSSFSTASVSDKHLKSADSTSHLHSADSSSHLHSADSSSHLHSADSSSHLHSADSSSHLHSTDSSSQLHSTDSSSHLHSADSSSHLHSTDSSSHLHSTDSKAAAPLSQSNVSCLTPAKTNSALAASSDGNPSPSLKSIFGNRLQSKRSKHSLACSLLPPASTPDCSLLPPASTPDCSLLPPASTPDCSLLPSSSVPEMSTSSPVTLVSTSSTVSLTTGPMNISTRSAVKKSTANIPARSAVSTKKKSAGRSESNTEVVVKDRKANPKRQKGVTWHRCTECVYATCCKSNYNKHIKRHRRNDSSVVTDKVKYVCHKCGKQFSTSFGLNLHNKNKHDLIFKYVCESCGKGFNQKTQFNNHCQQHKEKMAGTCPCCNVLFISLEDLVTHYQSCSRQYNVNPVDDELRCTICLSLFNSKSGLKEHISGKHQPPKYFCGYCDNRYCWRSSLKMHQKHTHNIY